MSKKIINKQIKKTLISYAKNYYNANKQKYSKNPDFERCRDEMYEYLKCNTCEFKDDCNKGEYIWEDNDNIIEDLAKELLKAIETRENNLLKGAEKRGGKN